MIMNARSSCLDQEMITTSYISVVLSRLKQGAVVVSKSRPNFQAEVCGIQNAIRNSETRCVQLANGDMVFGLEQL